YADAAAAWAGSPRFINAHHHIGLGPQPNGTFVPGRYIGARAMSINTHGKTIPAGTAVFVEKCARCSTQLTLTDVTRHAEREAHMERCIVPGDYVRWTSDDNANSWAEGVVSVVTVDAVHFTVHKESRGKTDLMRPFSGLLRNTRRVSRDQSMI